MLEAISRYVPRVLPDTQQFIKQYHEHSEWVRGPKIKEFEDPVSRLIAGGRSISTLSIPTPI